MSVYLPKGGTSWWYDFRWRGARHRGNTHQQLKVDAELVEAQVRLQLRRELRGIAVLEPAHTPRFQDWADIYLENQRHYTGRPDITERALRVVLEFWGARPKAPKKKPAVARAIAVAPPYHDLCLGHPIADPTWLLKFQEWIDARGVGGSTRNTYLSAMTGMYRLALQPEYRGVAKIEQNPFRDIRRSLRRKRLVALPAEQILAWVGAASYHVALAATIAALAPKMRLNTIVGLQWRLHFDRELTRITIHEHKTALRTGAPQITPISAQLREILVDAKTRSDSPFVINWRGEPVDQIKNGTRMAVERIGLTWGIGAGGVTFHSLRHSIATLLAKLKMTERLRMELLGHSEIRTTQQYTHLDAESQIEPHEQLSAALPLKGLMFEKPRHGREEGNLIQ